MSLGISSVSLPAIGLRITATEEGSVVKRVVGGLAALAILSAAAAAAQDAGPAWPDRPQLEVGAGGSVFFSGGTMPYTAWMVDTRGGVKVSRNWSVEGLVHVMPAERAAVSGFYRVQGLWRFGRGSFTPFLAFGAAGEFARYSWPEYRYTDHLTGEPRVVPAGSQVSITAPFYPTAAIGFQKVLRLHLAVRVELTAAFGSNDYGIAVAFVPAASVSIPIGRYRSITP
jgi:hypothetical protein